MDVTYKKIWCVKKIRKFLPNMRRYGKSLTFEKKPTVKVEPKMLQDKSLICKITLPKTLTDMTPKPVFKEIFKITKC